MMLFFCQGSYMLTSHMFFYSEKLELNKYYQGELCSIMSFYERQRYIIVFSYLIAVFLKFYNMYFYTYLEIHIEAKQKEC